MRAEDPVEAARVDDRSAAVGVRAQRRPASLRRGFDRKALLSADGVAEPAPAVVKPSAADRTEHASGFGEPEARRGGDRVVFRVERGHQRFGPANTAEGHQHPCQDLLRAAKAFFDANGGKLIGDELVGTDVTDFSPYLLKIRQAKPDIVCSNLAGNQVTNLIKQQARSG